MMSKEELHEQLSALGAESLERGASCPETARLAAYADGGLAGEERLAVEEHLADCAHCLGQVRFLVRTEDLGLPPEVPEHLLEAVRDEPRPAWRRPPAWLAAAAGLALVVLTVHFGLIEAPGESPSGSGVETEATVPSNEPRPVRNHVLETAVPTVTHPRGGQRIGRGGLTIAWEPIAEAMDYEVQLMDTEGNLVWEGRTGAQTTTIPPEVTLEPERRYFVWVAAHMRSGLRAKSPAVAFEVMSE